MKLHFHFQFIELLFTHQITGLFDLLQDRKWLHIKNVNLICFSLCFQIMQSKQSRTKVQTERKPIPYFALMSSIRYFS